MKIQRFIEKAKLTKVTGSLNRLSHHFLPCHNAAQRDLLHLPGWQRLYSFGSGSLFFPSSGSARNKPHPYIALILLFFFSCDIPHLSIILNKNFPRRRDRSKQGDRKSGRRAD